MGHDIEGFVNIDGVADGQSGCTGFLGAGISGDGSCVVDGNGDDGCWWNCFGAVGCHSPDCIPAYDGITATNVELYIWSPGAESEPEPEPDSSCRPEDLNANGQVDFYDLVQLLSEWDSTGLSSDLDGDGVTSFQDLLLVLSAWGSC